jgi:hypothetical protein
MGQRSTVTFPQDPAMACALLRELFPGWDIDYGTGVLGARYTAWRANETGRSGTDAYTPRDLAKGMEMFEEVLPWPAPGGAG